MTAGVIAVLGPTCTGKTTLAVRLAERLAPAELVNADSRQVLRGLRAGTCAPTEEELCGVRCHLLDLVAPGGRFSVAQWVDAARAAITDIEARGARAILVGGTGLYLTALEEGFDFGEAAPSPRRGERAALASRAEGLSELAGELRRRDPEGATAIDLRNPRRIVRALEILDAHPEGLRAARGRPRPTPLRKLGLDAAPPQHRQWVRARSQRIFRSGRILEEVRCQLREGLSDTAVAGAGIGYREALAVLAGESSVEAAVEATAARTLRYAKAQRTYWRRDPSIDWHDAETVQVEPIVRALRGGRRAR